MSRILVISMVVLFAAAILEFIYKHYTAFELGFFTLISYFVLKLAFYIERFFR